MLSRKCTLNRLLASRSQDSNALTIITIFQLYILCFVSLFAQRHTSCNCAQIKLVILCLVFVATPIKSFLCLIK